MAKYYYPAVSYVTNAFDLTTVTPENFTRISYASDTYILITASNVQSREAELCNIANWTQSNNSKLDRAKSVCLFFYPTVCWRIFPCVLEAADS